MEVIPSRKSPGPNGQSKGSGFIPSFGKKNDLHGLNEDVSTIQDVPYFKKESKGVIANIRPNNDLLSWIGRHLLGLEALTIPFRE